MIQIKKLNKSYGKKIIFNQTSFDFPNTGLVCILGPSGCGKSTLFNLMAGFDTNYEGEIVVHGKLLSELNEDELCSYRRNHIGFVFQNYHLIRGYTAKENVMMAVEAIGGTQKEQEVMDLFSQLDITSKADQKIETLSGGQKQRVAIARAIINHPSIIFADEPTGALDRNNSNEIMELLKNLSEKRLVVVITHDKKCAEYANQIVTIQNGKLICETNISKEIEDKYLKLKEAPKINIWKRAFKNFQVHLKRYGIVALAISIGILCFSLSLSSKT